MDLSATLAVIAHYVNYDIFWASWKLRAQLAQIAHCAKYEFLVLVHYAEKFKTMKKNE